MSEVNPWVQRPVLRSPRPPRVPPHPLFPGEENVEKHMKLISDRLTGGKARKFGSDLDATIVKFKKGHGLESRRSSKGKEKIDQETWDAIFTRPRIPHEPFQAIPPPPPRMDKT